MAPHGSSVASNMDGGHIDKVAACHGEPIDRSNMSLRIASIFIIFTASLIGAFLPLILAKHANTPALKKAFFFFTSVGTGVILATAWMHLLPPALEALHSDCLAGILGGYDWAMAIGLLTVIVMFLVEIVASGLGARGFSHREKPRDDAADLPRPGSSDTLTEGNTLVLNGVNLSQQTTREGDSPEVEKKKSEGRNQYEQQNQDEEQRVRPPNPHRSSLLGGGTLNNNSLEQCEGDLKGQLTTTFILEFGVLLHGVFIGLLMSTTNKPVILTIVFAFHQCFEGLGLGARLAVTPWPRHGRWWPYVFSLLYSMSAPLATVIGLAVQPESSASQLLVTGIFNSISAGILIYTGLVELLGRELLFDPEMQKAPLIVKLAAFGGVAVGASMMAILARWA